MVDLRADIDSFGLIADQIQADACLPLLVNVDWIFPLAAQRYFTMKEAILSNRGGPAIKSPLTS